MTAPTIDPATLTADVTANRLAELFIEYATHNNPGHFKRDAWDELVKLATVWQAVRGWGDEQDLDRNETVLQISDGSHDGVDPTRTNDNDWAPVLAHCPTNNTPAVEHVVYVGWPCSKVVRAA